MFPIGCCGRDERHLARAASASPGRRRRARRTWSRASGARSSCYPATRSSRSPAMSRLGALGGAARGEALRRWAPGKRAACHRWRSGAELGRFIVALMMELGTRRPSRESVGFSNPNVEVRLTAMAALGESAGDRAREDRRPARRPRRGDAASHARARRSPERRRGRLHPRTTHPERRIQRSLGRGAGAGSRPSAP
jgi:hypothetical protein